jgi:hypothetical protein
VEAKSSPYQMRLDGASSLTSASRWRLEPTLAGERRFASVQCNGPRLRMPPEGQLIRLCKQMPAREVRASMTSNEHHLRTWSRLYFSCVKHFFQWMRVLIIGMQLPVAAYAYVDLFRYTDFPVLDFAKPLRTTYLGCYTCKNRDESCKCIGTHFKWFCYISHDLPLFGQRICPEN